MALIAATLRCPRGALIEAAAGSDHGTDNLAMRRPGEVLDRAYLIDHVWDLAYEGGSNIVDVYVRYLRAKVDRPFGRETLQTVRHFGYRLDPAA